MEEMKQIEGKIKKIVQKEKNHLVFLEDKTMLSGWGECPKELVEGELYKFDYVKNGDWLNYKKYEKIMPDGRMKVPVETIEDKPNSQLKPASEYKVPTNPNQPAITLGQAYNQACEEARFFQHITLDTKPEAAKDHLKKLTKKHFENLQELQQELL